MDAKKEIYSYFDMEDKILVFTSETVARAWLQSYVLDNPGKAVFKDRAISWDSFTNLLLNKENRALVTDTERRSFVSQWFNKGNYEKMKAFASPSHTESRRAFARNLAKMLPYFPDLEEKGRDYLSDDIFNDISLIRPSYIEFLDKHQLYEKKYLKKDLSRIQKEQYVLVFPETFSDIYVKEVIASGLVKTIYHTEPKTMPKMKVYQNSISEIRETMRAISEDIKTTPYSEIALTCSSLDSYRAYLEEEAKRRDVPLIFTSRKPLLEYPEGRFFRALYEAYRDTYSLSTIKNLFMDPAYPFKNRELLETAIRIGIDFKIKDGGRRKWKEEFDYILSSQRLIDKYPRVEEIKELFLQITNAIRAIVEGSDAIKIERLIKEFRDTFFLPGAWNASENRLFGSCLEILEDMYSHELGNEEDTFDLYLRILEDKTYVEKSDNKHGIKVYAYPASCGMLSKIHYIIGLDDKTTKMVLDDYPYLPKETKPEEVDISTPILSLYSDPQFSEKLILSGTTEGLDGARLLPTLFLDHSEEMQGITKDSYQTEKDLWNGSINKEDLPKPFKKQVESYQKYGNKTSQKEMGFGERNRAESFDFSVSDIKAFDTCPYRGYAAALLKLKKMDYEPKIEDPFVIGNILHEAVQKALDEYKSFSKIPVAVLEANLIEATQNAKKKHRIPDEATASHIIGHYQNKMESVRSASKADSFAEGKIVGNEIEVKGVSLTPDIFLHGRIDTVLVDPSGEYLILDYKTRGNSDYDKTDLNKTSLQLILYAKLFEESGSQTNKDTQQETPVMVGTAGFYSFANKNYYIVWPPTEYTAGRRQYNEGFDRSLVDINADDRLMKIQTCLTLWDFQPEAADDNCTNCDYFRLCRERYTIK